jgi:hypothetical protein
MKKKRRPKPRQRAGTIIYYFLLFIVLPRGVK